MSRGRWAFPAAALLAGNLGCSSGGEGADTDGRATGPLYVVATQVFSNESSTTYYSFHDSVDVLDPEALVQGAREFPQVSNFEVLDGKLYVSSGEAPTVTLFDVSASGEWLEGETVSFANYGLGDNENWWKQYVLDAARVMLPFDTTSRAHWSPREMSITGELTESELPLEVDGLGVYNDGGNPARVRFSNGRAVQPFYTFGGPDEMYGPNSYVVVYDEQLDEVETLTVPCPDLETTTRSEDGTSYFSNTWHSGLYALFGNGLAPCVARVTPEGALDEDFTSDLTHLTGGRYTQNFAYLRGGKAIANVLHHDETDIDFEATSYDPALEYELLEGGYMRAWLFDLEAETAKEIAGIDVPLTQRPNTVVLDDRMLLLAVAPDFSSTRVYEISDDAVATQLFETQGTIIGWQRLR